MMWGKWLTPPVLTMSNELGVQLVLGFNVKLLVGNEGAAKVVALADVGAALFAGSHNQDPLVHQRLDGTLVDRDGGSLDKEGNVRLGLNVSATAFSPPLGK